jgi:hypothetical protein
MNAKTAVLGAARRWVLVAAAVSVLAIGIYPPFEQVLGEVTIPQGHGWIFDPPQGVERIRRTPSTQDLQYLAEHPEVRQKFFDEFGYLPRKYRTELPSVDLGLLAMEWLGVLLVAGILLLAMRPDNAHASAQGRNEEGEAGDATFPKRRDAGLLAGSDSVASVPTMSRPTSAGMATVGITLLFAPLRVIRVLLGMVGLWQVVGLVAGVSYLAHPGATSESAADLYGGVVVKLLICAIGLGGFGLLRKVINHGYERAGAKAPINGFWSL